MIPTSFSCPAHGEYPTFDAGRHEQSTCPVCRSGNQVLLDDFERQHRAFNRWQKSGVPLRFRNRRLGNFRPRTEDQATTLQLVSAWAAQREPETLALTGGVGLGKTHMAVGVVAAVIQQDMRAGFLGAGDALAQLREACKKGSTRSPDEVRAGWLAESDVLVLDDLGTTPPTPWGADQLGTLIATAYEDRHALLITANLPVAQLAEHIGERAVDRLAEMGAELQLAGHSFRAQAGTDAALAAAVDDFTVPPQSVTLHDTYRGEPRTRVFVLHGWASVREAMPYELPVPAQARTDHGRRLGALN